MSDNRINGSVVPERFCLTSGEIIARVKAWLHVEDRAIENTVPFEIVFNRSEAVEMTEHNAHEVMRGAEREYTEYTWETLKTPNDLFIVEGKLKQ